MPTGGRDKEGTANSMMKRWFKRMFLALLFDDEVRKEIQEALTYQAERAKLPPPPPRPNKYTDPFMRFE